MVTNETEIRIALQALLVGVLALYGFWGCALVVLVMLLPWKPILAIGGYLAQPIVDWRIEKAHVRRHSGMAQIEQELDCFLGVKETPRVPAPSALAKPAAPPKPSLFSSSRRLEKFSPPAADKPGLQEISGSAQNLAAATAIPPAIKNHVRNLPQGVFTNMDLEVEEVKFDGDAAEAYVKFKSPNVSELVIRQRYVLRKRDDRWQVESRQPANGVGKMAPPPFSSTVLSPMRQM